MTVSRELNKDGNGLQRLEGWQKTGYSNAKDKGSEKQKVGCPKGHENWQKWEQDKYIREKKITFRKLCKSTHE